MRKKQGGVTLMELLTVVAVVSILSTVAVSSYRRYLLRAQRSDATTALLQMQAQQEKHLLQYGVYVTAKADLTKAHTAGGLGLAATTSPRGFYDLDVASTTTGYTASATAVSGGGQAADTNCKTFTVNESGTRQAKSASNVDKTTECFR